MSKTFKRIIIAGILMIVLAGAAVGCTVAQEKGSPLEGAHTASINFALDHLGVKDLIEDKLHEQAKIWSDETGVPLSAFEEQIQALDVKDWHAIDMPEEAPNTITGEYSVTVEDTPISITAYEDPSYLTVEVWGQTATLSVPESAQSLTQFLPLLNYVEQ